ncbi:MAG: hypothetical protein OIF40_16875 [Mangrovicoccus sp.]|nr:hypothetical protein [Mangrovicoccus sp.]
MSVPVIAVIDGPLPAQWPGLRHVIACCELHPRIADSPARAHGQAVTRAIQLGCPEAVIDSYGVFPGRLATSVSAVCAGLEQALHSDADIVHCSFGMPEPAPRMDALIAALIRAGKSVVASAPARGSAAYPAGFDGVLSVQGDARCAPSAHSYLNLPHAKFGAYAGAEGDLIRGASRAAAHFTGLLAQAGGADMKAAAAYQGREHIC